MADRDLAEFVVELAKDSSNVSAFAKEMSQMDSDISKNVATRLYRVATGGGTGLSTLATPVRESEATGGIIQNKSTVTLGAFGSSADTPAAGRLGIDDGRASARRSRFGPAVGGAADGASLQGVDRPSTVPPSLPSAGSAPPLDTDRYRETAGSASGTGTVAVREVLCGRVAAHSPYGIFVALPGAAAGAPSSGAGGKAEGLVPLRNLPGDSVDVGNAAQSSAPLPLPPVGSAVWVRVVSVASGGDRITLTMRGVD